MSSKKLKIGVLIDQLIPGGVQRTAVEEVRHLNKFGHNAKLLVLSKTNVNQKYPDVNIPVEYITDRYPKLARINIKLPFFNFLSTPHFINPLLAPFKFKRGELDLIISHGTTISFTAFTIKKFKKIPYIIVIHDPMAYIWEKIYSKKTPGLFFKTAENFLKILEKNLIANSLICIIDSTVHSLFIKRNYKIEPKVAYLGINPPKTVPNSHGDAILSFGRWDMGKKPQILLEIMERLPKAKLIMAGSWTLKDDLRYFKNLIREKRLGKRISLITSYSDHNLSKISRQARLWIHPHFEAFSVSALEAASYSIPVIIPEKSGVTELFKNNIHGFFTKSENTKEFVEKIKILLNNKTLSEKMGAKAAKVARLYTWEKHTKIIDNYLKTLPNDNRIACIMNASVSTKSTGGGEHFLIELLKRVPEDQKITVIASNPGFFHLKNAALEKKPNITIRVLKKTPFDENENPILIFMAYLLRVIETFFILRTNGSFKKIHSASDLFPDVVPAFLSKITRPKTLWIGRLFHLIDPPPKRTGNLLVNISSYSLQKLSIILLGKADILMLDNSTIKNRLTQMGIKSNRIKVHYGGVDIEQIAKTRPVNSLASDAVFLGRILPHKGIFEAVEAWSQVVKSHPSALLNIIGHGPDNAVRTLENQIEKLNLKKNVNLIGYVHDKTKIYSYLRSTKILLFLDHEAGFGLAVAEAMAAGLPVICYNLSIFGNVYKKGFIKVPTQSAGQVANYAKSLLSAPAQREKISREAKIEAQRFSWEKAAKKFYREFALLN